MRVAAWFRLLGILSAIGPAGCAPTASLRAGQIAPELVVRDVAGRRYELGRLGGRITLLAFLAEDSDESHDLSMAVSALRGRYGSKGLRALGVWLDGSQESLGEFVRYRKLLHANVVLKAGEARRVAEQFGIRGVPALFIIGPQRRVIFSRIGYKPEDEGILEKQVREALSNQWQK